MQLRRPVALFLSAAAFFALIVGAAESSKLTAPGQLLPISSSMPTISGTTIVGQWLTASSGSWTGPSPTYAYQWQRCNSSGLSCLPIVAPTDSHDRLSGGGLPPPR